MPDTPPTIVHYREPGQHKTSCSLTGAVTIRTDTDPGGVTCFICRRQPEFKAAQLAGFRPPTPVRLSGVMADDAHLRDLAAKAAAHGRPGSWLAAQRNERGMYIVEESIHHGAYRSTRRVELYALNMVTLDAVIQSSAYCYGSWLNPENPDHKRVRNEKLRHLVEDLKAGRENRDVGWSTFRLITNHSS